MEVLQAGSQIFKFADRHASNVSAMLQRADFGSSIADPVRLNYEVSMMGTMWQLAANMVKDMVDPLKSIVNK